MIIDNIILNNIYIYNSTDAVFINLSPEKVCNFSQDMDMFLHIVMKVAREFQPTILYIEEAHRVFHKKIPPEEKDILPTLLAPYIQKKILKPIKKSDKIVLLGTTSLPWMAKPLLKRNFQKILLIPKCDYGTCFLLWLDLMTENAPEALENYAYSALAKIMKAYNSGDVANSVSNTLSVSRKMRLKAEALDPMEFLEYFLTEMDPPLFPPEDKVCIKIF